MPRKGRKDVEGMIHHASMRGVDGELVFRSDEDRIGFVLMLAATVARFGWQILSYCLMGTHIHVLVRTPEPNFGRGMQWLLGRYGACFNRQHHRDGHLFQGRYHDEPVETEAHLINVVGYIAANPVEAGLCRDPRRWRWSSHAVASSGRPPFWLAHDLLVVMLQEMHGLGAYERIIATRLRRY